MQNSAEQSSEVKCRAGKYRAVQSREEQRRGGEGRGELS